MTDADKYKAVEAIIDEFYQNCPRSDASNVALGTVLAIAAVVKLEEGDADAVD